MRIIVLGGGIIGVTTAYFLAKEGHEVEVIERQAGLALDASSGNAGLIGPGHSYSWASPAAPKMLLQSLRGAETAIRVRLRPDPELVRWGLRFLAECPTSRSERNTLIKLRLCQYSQKLLNEVSAEEKIDYRQTYGGILFLYRDEADLETANYKAKLMREHGQEQEVLDAAATVAHEPALAAARDKFAGAVHEPAGSSGDCEIFTNRLASRCEELGVRIRRGAAVHRFDCDSSQIHGAVIDGETLRADAYVIALGVDSAALARTAGYRLPVYPAKGYSVTFPIREEHNPPTAGGVDEGTLVAWSNFGDRLRMSSTAEFSGYDRSWADQDFSNIMKMAKDLMPDAADYSAGQYRACLRPMTPGGPPVIGWGRHRNLLFNTGHGHMGWTMACGSARLAADLIERKQPEIDMTGMDVPT
ncbi:MAG: D-amino acid dehydrogenase [Solirubrobacterales bacterium]